MAIHAACMHAQKIGLILQEETTLVNVFNSNETSTQQLKMQEDIKLTHFQYLATMLLR